MAGNVAAGFVGPLVNRRAIKADYLSSNAQQVQAVYDYQRTVLEAFTEVVNRLTRGAELQPAASRSRSSSWPR